MGYIGPWSNFHELNLDWLLREVKQLRTDVDGLQGSSMPSDDAPMMDGIADAGLSVNYSRGDHVHPTDTSRASQSDLDQEVIDRGNADVQLGNDIADVDAKIKFSSGAPLMDSSSASAGFSDYMARADHVHPTDTSRASATDLATLTVRVDNITGAASPYDVMPQMDGAGTYGTIGAYSRGDHQHPSDTSKLDVAGGTITGNLRIEGVLTQEHKSAYLHSNVVSWIRVANVPDVQGTQAIIHIQKKGTLTPPEFHDIKMEILSAGAVFSEEHSIGDALYVNKIRYSNAGYIDIHSDQSYDCDISIYIEPHGPTETAQENITMLQTPIPVADAPAGESIVAEYTFHQNTRFLIETGTSSGWDYQLYSDKFVVADAYVTDTITHYNVYFTNMYAFFKQITPPFTMADTKYYVDYEWSVGAGFGIPGGLYNLTTSSFNVYAFSNQSGAQSCVIRLHLEGYIA